MSGILSHADATLAGAVDGEGFLLWHRPFVRLRQPKTQIAELGSECVPEVSLMSSEVRFTLIPPDQDQWREFYDLPDEVFLAPGKNRAAMTQNYLEARLVSHVDGKNLTTRDNGIAVGLLEMALVLPWFVRQTEESRDAEWDLWYLSPHAADRNTQR